VQHDHMGVVGRKAKIHASSQGRFTAARHAPPQRECSIRDTNSWKPRRQRSDPESLAASRPPRYLSRHMIVLDGGEWPPESRTFTENEGTTSRPAYWVSLAAPLPEGSHGVGAGVIGPNLYSWALDQAGRRRLNRSDC